MNNYIKIKTKNSMVSKAPMFILAIIPTLALLAAQYISNAYGLPGVSFLHFITFALVTGICIFFLDSMELLMIPIALSIINRFFYPNFLSIGLLLEVILFVAILLGTINKLDKKYIKIASVIYALGNIAIMILPLIQSTENLTAVSPLLIFTNALEDITIMIAILSSNIIHNEDGKKIAVKKIIMTVITVLVCIALFLALSSKYTSKDTNTPMCGHQSCAENGPFPCYGKNNTCPNKTYCAYDPYCDSCD